MILDILIVVAAQMFFLWAFKSTNLLSVLIALGAGASLLLWVLPA